MLYLILAILSSTTISLFMRLSEKYIKNNMTMFIWNYIICMGMALLFKGKIPLQFETHIDAAFTIGLGLISGILYLVNFVFYQVNIQKNGVVLSGTFMKLGVIVPVLMALFIFHEQPGFLQLIGCLIAIIAIVLVQFEKDAAGNGKYKVLLILLLLISGLTDSLSNVYDKMGNSLFKDDYLILTFFAAMLSAFILKMIKKQKTILWDVLFGIIIGIPNYFSARFLLLALGKLSAIVVYPVYSVATIVCITCAGMLIFHEKLTKQKMVAVWLIMVALVCINL